MDREKVIKGLNDIGGFIAGRVGFEQARNFLRTIDDAIALLEEQEERWIPVTERLPRSMANKVIVYVQHEDYVGYIGYGHYEKYKGQEMWFDLDHDEEFSKRGYHVTHWMETPMPPREGR